MTNNTGTHLAVGLEITNGKEGREQRLLAREEVWIVAHRPINLINLYHHLNIC